MFTVSKLGLKSLQSVATLKAKGYNTLIVAFCLADVVAREANRRPHDERLQLVAAMMWGYTSMLSVMQRAGQWLTDAEAQELERSRCAALLCNAALSGQGPQFPMKPKHHLVDHMCRECVHPDGRQNPTWFWTFNDEGLVGHMKTLAQRCHRTTLSRRVSERYMVRDFQRLHTAIT